jgi:DNA-binding MarR family transcriptional regulator
MSKVLTEGMSVVSPGVESPPGEQSSIAAVYNHVRDQVIYSMVNGDWSTNDLIAWLNLRADRAKNSDAPHYLTPAELRLLYRLWDEGYVHDGKNTAALYLRDKSEIRTGRTLVKYGYIIRNPTAAVLVRVTEAGVRRLQGVKAPPRDASNERADLLKSLKKGMMRPSEIKSKSALKDLIAAGHADYFGVGRTRYVRLTEAGKAQP